MTYALFLGFGLLAGLLLSWFFAVPVEQQTVCILNCDGKEHRQTCVSTQSKKCFDDLRTNCS